MGMSWDLPAILMDKETVQNSSTVGRDREMLWTVMDVCLKKQIQLKT
jgi:hypothetical protein